MPTPSNGSAYPKLSTRHLEIHPDKEAVSRAAAQAVVVLARQAVEQKESFSLVLAGGSTPRRLYELLATEYLDYMPWDHTRFFWGDERYVPFTDSRSNFAMVREAMFLEAPVDADQIHPMPTEASAPEDSADMYESDLMRLLEEDEGCFDLVLLGMGDDGHTASLFPGSPALDETERWVVAAPAPVDPRQRLTLTFPILNKAKNVFFLVAGPSKAEAMQCVFGNPDAITECPAARIKPDHGRLIWWVDEAAVTGLDLNSA